MEIKINAQKSVDLEQLYRQSQELSVVVREDLVEDELEAILARVYNQRQQTRNWSPWNQMGLAEQMHRRPLDPNSPTVDLIEGFMGIEEFIGDFGESVKDLRGNCARVRYHFMWCDDEMRHGATLEQVLIHSGARSSEQIRNYRREMWNNHKWHSSDHAGVDSPRGAAVYTALQERDTYINYDELEARVRKVDYKDYPKTDEEKKAEEERQRARKDGGSTSSKVASRLVGAEEALRIVAGDENVHHVSAVQIVKADLRWFPLEVLSKMQEIYLDKTFHMPSTRRLPNSREFLRAIGETNLITPDIFRQRILLPTLRQFGLPDEEALRTAVSELKRLAEVA